MKKLYKLSISIGIVLLLSTVSVALAYTYRAPYVVTNNSSTDYGMIGVIAYANNQWLANNGFMNSSANDTRVQTLGGLNKPWMVADNKTLTAIPVEADSQNNLYFTTGESEASAMNILTGYGGYITTPDFALGEIGNNGSTRLNGVYLNESGTIFEKGNLSVRYDTSTSNLTLYLPLDLNLFTKVDASGKLTVTAENVTGEDVDTDEDVYLYYDYGSSIVDDFDIKGSMLIKSSTVDGGISGVGMTVNTVDDYTGFDTHDPCLLFSKAGATYRLYFYRGAVAFDYCDLSADTYYYYNMVRASGSDNISAYIYSDSNYSVLVDTLFLGGFGTETFRYVYNLVNTNSGAAGKNWDGIFSLLDWPIFTPTITITGYTVNEHDIEFNINPTSCEIVVDSSNTTVAGAYTIPNTYNNLTFSNFAYCDSIEIYKNGVRTLYYQPTSMIVGNTLPDHEGNQDGTITWGTNPAGISVNLESLVASSQPEIGTGLEEPTTDILPPIDPTNWFVNTLPAGLATHPLRPFVVIMSDFSTMTELQAWRFLGLAMLLLVTVVTAFGVKGHQLITAIAASAGIGLLAQQQIWPYWALILIIPIVGAGILAERTPSL